MHQYQKYASIDIETLAFNRIDEDPCFISIPIKDGKGYVICENRMNGNAMLKRKQAGEWRYTPLDFDVVCQIYARLKGDT